MAKRKFTEFLRDGALVAVHLDGERPLFVPKSLISSASEIFASRIELEDGVASKTGPSHILRLEHEDSEAAEILMFYIATGRLPDAPSIDNMTFLGFANLIDSWLLGCSYRVIEFMDLVMLELIRRAEGGEGDWDHAKVAIKVQPHSKLARLLIEEIVVDLEVRRSVAWEMIELFEGTVGFLGQLGSAKGELQKRGGKAWRRFEDEGDLWKEYMTGDGPKKHWALK